VPVPRAVCSTEGELSELFPLYFQAGRQHRQPHTHLPERPACAPRRGWVSLAPEHQHYLEWRSIRGHGTPACPRRRAPRVKALTNFCRFAQFMRLMHSCESSIYRESRGPGTQVTESQHMPSCDMTWSTAARPPQPVENVSAIAEGGVKHRWRTPELLSSCSQAKGQHRHPRTHLPGRPACAPRRGWVSSSGAPALPGVVDTRSRHACWPAALRAAAQSVDKLLSFHTVNAVHALLRVACLLRKPGGW
jgi:hypothetical protein